MLSPLPFRPLTRRLHLLLYVLVHGTSSLISLISCFSFSVLCFDRFSPSPGVRIDRRISDLLPGVAPPVGDNKMVTYLSKQRHREVGGRYCFDKHFNIYSCLWEAQLSREGCRSEPRCGQNMERVVGVGGGGRTHSEHHRCTFEQDRTPKCSHRCSLSLFPEKEEDTFTGIFKTMNMDTWTMKCKKGK